MTLVFGAESRVRSTCHALDSDTKTVSFPPLGGFVYEPPHCPATISRIGGIAAHLAPHRRAVTWRGNP